MFYKHLYFTYTSYSYSNHINLYFIFFCRFPTVVMEIKTEDSGEEQHSSFLNTQNHAFPGLRGENDIQSSSTLSLSEPTEGTVVDSTIGKTYTCDFCEIGTSTAEKQAAAKPYNKCDAEEYIDKKPHKCNICEYSTGLYKRLTQHKKKHVDDKPYNCEECGYSTAYGSQFKRHKLTHMKEKPNKCDICDYSCVNLSYLNTHKQKIHGVERPSKCILCDYSTPVRGDLIKHVKLMHAVKTSFTCDICDYTTSLSGNMKRHMLVHTQQKPFKCDKCTFST